MLWHMGGGATRATKRKLHAAIARSAVAAALLAFASWCPSQPAVQSPQDAAMTQIVALESLAATAVGEGHIAAAIDDHSRALQVAETLQRPRLVAVLLTRLGLLYEDDSKIQRGLIAHELALKALDRDADLDLSPVIQRLGSGRKGFDARPEPVSADLYRESVARDLDAEQQDPALPVKVLINIGNGYLRQPQDEAALRAYRLALERPEIAGAPLQKAHALANSGEILRRQGKLDEAQSALEGALALIEREGKQEDARRALASLARIAAQRSDVDGARALYSRAIALYRASADRRGEARAQLGRGYLELTQNRIQDASGAYQRALDLGTATNDEDVLWQSHWGLGRCAYARGELDRAAASYAASLTFIAQREGDLTTDEGKVALIQQARDAFDQLLLVDLERAKRDPARYADALSVAEDSRARALSRLMQGWSGQARPSPASLGLATCYRPPPVETVECRPSLTSGAMMNQFAGATAAGRSDCEPARPRVSVAQMALATPTEPALQPPAPPPSAPMLPPSPDKEVPTLPRLIFHVLADRTAVFAVARDGTVRGHVVPIGADALAQRVEALRAALNVDRSARSIVRAASTPRAVAPASEQQLLRAFYTDMIAPVADGLPKGKDVLVIEPHGPLWLVPFAALVRADGGWFGDRYQLVYAPSASAMDELRRAARNTRDAEPRALVIGNPLEVARVAGADDPFRGSFAPLPGAEAEAKQVSALFSGQRSLLLLGAKANLETVEKEARSFGILHFATHGVANPDRPLDSFLLLSTSACEDRLSARRIMTLPLSAELVTLSACQTGLGNVSGEGVIGLSRAFFVAGARSVLVSLWSVSDEATRRLMAAFYEHYIRDGMTKVEALAAAMGEVRATEEFRSPRYWAPFILVGAET